MYVFAGDDYAHCHTRVLVGWLVDGRRSIYALGRSTEGWHLFAQSCFHSKSTICGHKDSVSVSPYLPLETGIEVTGQAKKPDNIPPVSWRPGPCKRGGPAGVRRRFIPVIMVCSAAKTLLHLRLLRPSIGWGFSDAPQR